MSKEHTPIPWRRKDSTQVYAEGRHIADCSRADSCLHIGIENSNNAEFIVKAVNCHDELLEALRHVLSVYEAGDEYKYTLDDLNGDLIRAALNKAETVQ